MRPHRPCIDLKKLQSYSACVCPSRFAEISVVSAQSRNDNGCCIGCVLQACVFPPSFKWLRMVNEERVKYSVCLFSPLLSGFGCVTYLQKISAARDHIHQRDAGEGRVYRGGARQHVARRLAADRLGNIRSTDGAIRRRADIRAGVAEGADRSRCRSADPSRDALLVLSDSDGDAVRMAARPPLRAGVVLLCEKHS